MVTALNIIWWSEKLFAQTGELNINIWNETKYRHTL